MAQPGSAATNLRELCAVIGPRLIEVVTAPAGLDREISGVALHGRDEAFEGDGVRGCVLLVVGLEPDDPNLDDLIRTAAAAGVAAIASRSDKRWHATSLATAEQLDLTILSVTSNVGWDQLYKLIDAATRRDDVPIDGDTRFLDEAADLTAVAEAVAAIAGGPVTIDDMQFRIVAFSGSADGDEARTEAILSRYLPERWMTEVRRQKVTQKLLLSNDVIHFTFDDMAPRRAIAIRIGGSVFGSIWLAGEDDGLSDDADAALRHGANVAALQMMRRRLSVNVERHVRESILGSLLMSGEVGQGRIEQLGLSPHEGFVVIAIDVIARSTSSPPIAGPRLIDLLTLDLGGHARPAVGMSRSDNVPGSSAERIYVLTNVHGTGSNSLLRGILGDLLKHASRTLGVELRGAIGHTVDGPESIADARQSADDCLDLEFPPGTVVEFDEVHASALLRDVLGMVSARRGGTSSPFRTLVTHDEEDGTDYVATLVNLMDAFGNSSIVAKKMHLHPNTIRYRIRRITEITGVNLSDGTARLSLELELRAHLGTTTPSAPPLLPGPG